MSEGKFIIVPKARPAVDFASNLLVIPKDDFDEYVKAIDRHHVKFVRSLEMSLDVAADGRAMEAVKMAKEHYEKIIVEKDKQIEELKKERRWRKFSEEKPEEEMEGEDFLVSNGYYSVVCEWRGYWNNEPFCGDKNCDEVKYWMPLQSAPKEEYK